MGTIGAIVGGTVLSAAATAYAASSASNSANQANATNAANVAATNQLNYQMYQQSRGSTGSAIYPIYAAGSENQLYNDAVATYNATGGVENAPTLQDYQNIVSQSIPAAQLATQAANGVFNGQTVGQELTNQQPVSAANLALAQTQKQSSLEALQQTLNNIKSIQAGKGYSGDSYTNQLLNFQARQSANTQGAQAIAGANLTNAGQVQGIQQNAINRQLANINLPSTAAGQQINLAQAPANALESQQVNRQNLLANFRIGTAAPFQYTPSPLITPTASTGQIVGQAIGSVAGSTGNLVADQYLINQLKAPTAGGVQTSISPGVSVDVGGSGVSSTDVTPQLSAQDLAGDSGFAGFA